MRLGPTTGINRGDADGWRTDGVLLVFGGWSKTISERDDVRILDESFVHVGKLVVFSGE